MAYAVLGGGLGLEGLKFRGYGSGGWRGAPAGRPHNGAKVASRPSADGGGHRVPKQTLNAHRLVKLKRPPVKHVEVGVLKRL